MESGAVAADDRVDATSDFGRLVIDAERRPPDLAFRLLNRSLPIPSSQREFPRPLAGTRDVEASPRRTSIAEDAYEGIMVIR
jgi:hypothetical protein